MTNKPSKLIAAAALGLLWGWAAAAQAAVVLEDSFTSFALGTRWQSYGAGVPDLALSIVGVGADGASLRLGASPGTAGEEVGIETATPIPMAGVRLVRVTVRLRPLNQTGAGNGGLRMPPPAWPSSGPRAPSPGLRPAQTGPPHPIGAISIPTAKAA